MKLLTPDLEFGCIKYCYSQLLHCKLVFRNIFITYKFTLQKYFRKNFINDLLTVL